MSALPGTRIHAMLKRALPFAAGLGLLACAADAGASPSPDRTPEALTRTVAALDAAVFDTFNACTDPAKLARHAEYFDENVEFYHDTGGVTWTRDDMIGRTRANVCGRYRRELVPGTLEVFPVPDFGAIARGTHRFCAMAATECPGEADFTMVWRERDGRWQVTRVLSYAHRAAPVAP